MPNDLRALLKNSVSYEPGRLEESNYPFVFEFNYEEMLQTLECAERLGYDRGYNQGRTDGIGHANSSNLGYEVLATALVAWTGIQYRKFKDKKKAKRVAKMQSDLWPPKQPMFEKT
ncbi:hypothetical protein COU60_02395 [Candidatus Pacearchaeota archaeon CG10_big_fil_rev_8_21_14_0_10_34_76]|nr:MAG: hypothetical protein COU60_02395 [Candidatus Pacearchaeota archaeon CG10_big_fil_rev_8_21_14_0_10_34_76]